MSKFFLTLDELQFYLNCFVKYDKKHVSKDTSTISIPTQMRYFFFSMITSRILAVNKTFLKTVKHTYEMNVDLKKNSIMEIVVVCLV